jgi:hypothetical protein
VIAKADAFGMKDILFKLLTHRTPLRLALARKLIKRFSLFSYEDRLSIDAIDRPHYGCCIFQAARFGKFVKLPQD